ncbi:hypothetical protein [Actinomadura roseirufa]|uniref:hypothetical protein n=1 Tax=Actinomadura roseirufa TaxID=2094049 RepID=UPI001041320D|nr:hypothetical protein [Actinomadura roseirufa]
MTGELTRWTCGESLRGGGELKLGGRVLRDTPLAVRRGTAPGRYRAFTSLHYWEDADVRRAASIVPSCHVVEVLTGAGGTTGARVVHGGRRTARLLSSPITG